MYLDGTIQTKTASGLTSQNLLLKVTKNSKKHNSLNNPSDYPDKISLVTTDLQTYEREFLGVYYKTDKQASGRPVWKQPSGALYIIYNGNFSKIHK